MKLSELDKAAVADFAVNLPRDYPERYRKLLHKAFRDYRGVLNANQLRELAGGGSPNTAQKAITDFMEELQNLLAFRLPEVAPTPQDNASNIPSSGVPDSLQAAMSQLTLDAWRLARKEFEEQSQAVAQQARDAIEAAQRHVAHAQSEALATVEIERQARVAAEVEAERQHALAAAAREREQQLDNDLRSAQAALQELQTALARSLEQTEEHHRHLAQANASFERMSKEHAQALLLLQRESQNKLDQLRQDLRQQVDALTRERDRALNDLNRTRERAATADIEHARAQQTHDATLAELAAQKLANDRLTSELAIRTKEATAAEALSVELRSQQGIVERDLQRLAAWIDNAKGTPPVGLSNPAALVLGPLKRRLTHQRGASAKRGAAARRT